MSPLLFFTITAFTALVVLGCRDTDVPSAPAPLFAATGYICPNNFTFDAAYTAAEGERNADRNMDGIACWIEVASNGNAHRVYVDNNVPVEWTGACPDGFAPARVLDHPVDANGDRVVCFGRRPNGEEVAVDNRF